MGSLESAIIKILKSMNVLTDILSDEPKNEVSFSNGENVSSIGLLRYYTLELMSSLLKLPSKLVSEHFDE
jgi:hypothetical protein